MNIAENGIYLNLGMKRGEAVRLLHFSSHPQEMEIGDDDVSVYTLAELQASGFNQNDHHGLKHTGSSPSLLMTYEDHRDYRNDYGRKLEVIQKYKGLELITHIQFYDGISAEIPS